MATAPLLGGFEGVSRPKKAQVVAADAGGALPASSVSSGRDLGKDKAMVAQIPGAGLAPVGTGELVEWPGSGVGAEVRHCKAQRFVAWGMQVLSFRG